MDDSDWLAERFEEHRPRLTAVAYRMLGSAGEADDAVQEAWLRLEPRRTPSAIENLGGWLTTVVVAGVPEHAAGAPRRGREEPLDARRARAGAGRAVRPRARGAAGRLGRARAAGRARHADPRGAASRSCCTTCSACRSTRSRRSSAAPPPATRQLASRARRRVQARTPARTPTGSGSARLVDAFLAAARGGDFDGPARRPRPRRRPPRRRGRGGDGRSAGDPWGSRRRRVLPARPRSQAGAPRRSSRRRVAAPTGPRVVYRFTVSDERITAIDLIADPAHLQQLDLVILND